MKAAGVGLTAALAGCTGDGGGGDGGDGGGGDGGDGGGGDGGDGGGGDGGDGDTPTAAGPQTATPARDTLAQSLEADLSGTTINWWNIANVQAQVSKQAVNEFVSNYQNDTGVNVKVNHSGYAQLSGAKWISQFRRGSYPPVMETEPTYNGRFYQGGWLLPYDEWKVGLDDSVVEGLSWLKPTFSVSTKGFRSWAYDIPWGFLPRNPQNARTDIIEEAGLDPDNDLPFDGLDDWMEKAKQVEENTDAVGYQIFGAKFDHNDWDQQIGLGMQKESAGAKILNEEWTDVHWGSDQWTTALDFGVDLFQNEGIGVGGTPTLSDEKTTSQMIQGSIAMSSVEWLNIPVFLNRFGDGFTGGDFRWYRHTGHENNPYAMGYYSVAINRPPQGADTEKWRRKQQAGIVLNNRWLTHERDWHPNLVNNVGGWPANDKSWGDVSVEGDENHHATEVAFDAAEKSNYGWETHPGFPSLMFHIPAPILQQMLQGQKEVDTGMQEIYDECQALL